MSKLIFRKSETGTVIVIDTSLFGDNDKSIISHITPNGRVEYLQIVSYNIKKEIRDYIKRKY